MFPSRKKAFQILISLLLLGLNNLCIGQTAQERECNLHRTEVFNQFEKWLDSKKTEVSLKNNEILRVPVVVHIIHSGESIGEGSNITDEQVHSQIRILNEDFRRKVGSQGFNDHPDGGDAEIEFVLAASSPDGKATNGIIRINRFSLEAPSFGGSMIALGAYYNIWDPNSYLNIWAFPGFQDTALGEARFPVSDLPGLEDGNDFSIPGFDSLHGIPVSEIDGVAINSVHFGETNINSVYNLGRTGTHEIGHFLGLFHLWGDQGFEGSCDIDDYCEDTPLVDSRTSGCPMGKLACDGKHAMIENYMDYTNDVCMNIFTNDQIQRMRTVLKNSPRRKSLLTSGGLLPPDDIVNTDDQYESEINIYPNPFTNLITIENLPNTGSNQIVISISNLNGQIIQRQIYKGQVEKIEFRVPQSNHSVLFLMIQSEEFTFCKKIIQI